VRLSPETLSGLPSCVLVPGYDRAAQKVGIVHFGVGAFHRAHQAAFTDETMAHGDRDWGIVGVSPRSPAVYDALAPQGGLYSLTERSPAGESVRVIGALQRVLIAPREPETVVEALASVDTQIVTLTITEKGYCRMAGGGLDLAAAGTVETPTTVYGFLALGLARRKAASLGGVTLLSCDNLASNGATLFALVADYLEAQAPDLASWFAAECTAPNTMVDRIVPAATAADLATVAATIGQEDHGAVVAEPFRQWVIEDRFAGPRPRWETAGAQFASDVAPYEMAKLRILNGAHSALAYLGLARGHDFVHQAVADPVVGPLVERLMRQEAAPSFVPAPGQDLDAYASALLTRFANTALPHRLSQIAADGSQKIPQRWLDTLADSRDRGRSCPAILSALSAWIVYVRGETGPVDDPLASRLARLWVSADARGMVEALFSDNGPLNSRWRPSPSEVDALLVGA
jgi:fructuronate reductase